LRKLASFKVGKDEIELDGVRLGTDSEGYEFDGDGDEL
jgi:hypothetical protein